MTTYKMPEVLGGGEYEALTDFVTRAGNDHRYRFNIPGVGLVDVPQSGLTEVKPPLPEEPPVGAFVIVGLRILQRRDDHGIDWWDYSDRCWYTWAQLCELVTPVRLVPAPAPMELPWSGQTAYGSSVSVLALVTGKVNDVANDGNGKLLVVTMTPDLAREKARALNTAADKAEAEATS